MAVFSRSTTNASSNNKRRSSTTGAATTTLTVFVLLAVVVYGINYYNNQALQQSTMTKTKTLQQQQQSSSSSSSNPTVINDAQWKRELLARLDRIRASCGDLCSMNNADELQARAITTTTTTTTSDTTIQSNFVPLRVPNVNCSAIIGNEDLDASDWTFPSHIPDELLPHFTLDGLVNVQSVNIYKTPYQGGGLANIHQWTQQGMEDRKQQAMKDMPTLHGTYSPRAVRMVREKLRQLHIADKSVLVIGSETPWVEAICLGLGAALITTLEYGVIESTHPQIKTLTPAQFRQRYQQGTLGTFDVVVSHSSLEHSGLGRYGDALNPWGDILAMARAWCVTKPGGGLYLGLPTGKDKILFNAHRVYGKHRWPLITTNWQQVDAMNHTEEEFHVNAGIDVQYGGTGFLFRKATTESV